MSDGLYAAYGIASVTKVALNELISIANDGEQTFLSYLLQMARDECDLMLSKSPNPETADPFSVRRFESELHDALDKTRRMN